MGQIYEMAFLIVGALCAETSVEGLFLSGPDQSFTVDSGLPLIASKWALRITYSQSEPGLATLTLWPHSNRDPEPYAPDN